MSPSQDQSPALSIVTVTFRDPEGLRKTFASLAPLASSALGWEHVIVDSSPGENAGILREQGGARVVHVTEPPRGIYAAMNTGIKRARGEILWFLNSGDLLDSAPDLLNAVNTLTRSQCDLLVATARITKDGEWQYDQKPRAGLLPLLGINRVCHQAVLFRRRAFEKLGAFSEELRLASDYDFHLRALAEKVPVIALDVPIVRYDRGGRSATETEKVFGEFRRVHQKLASEGKLPWAPLHGPVRLLEKARIRFYGALASAPGGQLLRKARNSFRRLLNRA